MYKVFIDHKPILLLTSDKKNDSFVSLEFKEGMSFARDIKPFLKGIKINAPLQLICEDVEYAFSQLFSQYKKVKAAGGIVQRKSKYLIIKRNGKWDIPKGKIDKGEKKRAAAVREIEEECGIEGPVVRNYLVTTYHVFNYKGRKAIKKTFWYNLDYSGPKISEPQLEEGITKVKWVSETELLAIRSNTYGSINEVLDAFIKEKSRTFL